MKLSGVLFLFILHTLLCVPQPLIAQTPATAVQSSPSPTELSVWQSSKAKHLFGFPDIKQNKKGQLTLGNDSLTFESKSGKTAIERSSITAVEAGDERVEIGGMTVRLIRMGMQYGGGLATAALLHHRIDLLTVQFKDGNGGVHSAVFLLLRTKPVQRS